MKRSSKLQVTDPFAAIGAMRRTCRDEQLKPVTVSPLPDIDLPSMQPGTGEAFAPAPKLSTAADVKAALKAERQERTPFLRDLAPKLRDLRPRQVLRDFDWRRVERDSSQTFEDAKAGKGSWEQVTIPHYGPPPGRALAYYRTTFRAPTGWQKSGSMWVKVAGADYRARLYVNGRCVGEHEGFFATFEFDISNAVKPGKNTLLIELRNEGTWNTQHAAAGDKLYAATGPGWDEAGLGWHHCPAGMGLLGPVTIEVRPRLFLHDVWVRPLASLDAAEIKIDVHNCDTTAREPNLNVAVFGQNFLATALKWQRLDQLPTAAAGRSHYQCTVPLPRGRRWSPASPWLYQVQVQLLDADGNKTDTAKRQFGLRTFRIDETTTPKGRLFLNDEPIRLRGANTMGFEQQDVMTGRLDKLRDDLLLARLTNFNFLRLTQRPVQPEIYEMADKVGIMLQTDLPLFTHIPRSQYCEAIRQAGEMARHVRAHPSVVMLSYINEPFSAEMYTDRHRHIFRHELEAFFTAATAAVRVEHPDIAIKPVDGDYDPPAEGLPDYHLYTLWYQGHGQAFGRLHQGEFPAVKPNWCFGCGEYGSEGLDPVSLMRRRYPAEWMPQTAKEEAEWTPSRIAFAQSGRHQPIFFDRPTTLRGWVAASQDWQACGVRLQTEAFRRMDLMVSCAVHLFIDAWPAGWMKSIMDCERRPKPAWFACREAMAPWLPMARTDRLAFRSGEEHRFEIWLANDTPTNPDNWRLRYALQGNGGVVASGTTEAKPQTNSPAFQGFLPWIAPEVTKRTEFTLQVGLFDARDKIVNDSTITVTVWPRLTTAQPTIDLLTTGGRAEALANELSAQRDADATVLLADRLPGNRRDTQALLRRVEAGATLVLTELPAGQHRIGPDEIEVKPCGFAPYDFVSRATGHPAVAGMQMEDFRFWHDAPSNRIEPLLFTTFQAPNWTPILVSGEAGWGQPARPALAAAERPWGQGRIILSLVALAGRTTTNPAADIFARRMLQQT